MIHIQNGKDLYSDEYQDIYFSREGGLEEKNYVFLDANDAENRFKNSDRIRILELGFGAGLNFTVTVEKWIRCRKPGSVLEYFSIEKNPVPFSILEEFYSSLNVAPAVKFSLLEKYKYIKKGLNKLIFNEYGVSLFLIADDLSDALNEVQDDIHIFFLDGFSPSKNPEMWSEPVFLKMAELSVNGSSFSTYSCASFVRRNAEAAGFSIETLKGFGRKKKMLRGFIRKDNEKITNFNYFSIQKERICSEVVILGAGLAGCSLAYDLAKKGIRSRIVDRGTVPASEGSGNPAGIFNPKLALGKNEISLLSIYGYMHFQRRLSELQNYLNEDVFRRTGVFHILKGDEKDKAERLISISGLEKRFCQISEQYGHSGILFPESGWISPAFLCQLYLNLASGFTETSFGTEIESAETDGNKWMLKIFGSDSVIETENLVLANAFDISRFAALSEIPFRRNRGQIIFFPSFLMKKEIRHTVMYDEGYFIPANDKFVIGTVYDHHDFRTELNLDDCRSLFEKFSSFFPGYLDDPGAFEGRVGFRAWLPDHLPVCGPVPDWEFYKSAYSRTVRGGRRDAAEPKYQKGLYVLSGLASRGMLFSSILSEYLSSVMTGESVPMDRKMCESVHPARFLLRKMKKGLT